MRWEPTQAGTGVGERTGQVRSAQKVSGDQLTGVRELVHRPLSRSETAAQQKNSAACVQAVHLRVVTGLRD